MKSAEEITQEVLSKFDEETKDISRSQYIEVLSDIISDLESRLEAAENEGDEEE